jgi:hypothetical protein
VIVRELRERPRVAIARALVGIALAGAGVGVGIALGDDSGSVKRSQAAAAQRAVELDGARRALARERSRRREDDRRAARRRASRRRGPGVAGPRAAGARRLAPAGAAPAGGAARRAPLALAAPRGALIACRATWTWPREVAMRRMLVCVACTLVVGAVAPALAQATPSASARYRALNAKSGITRFGTISRAGVRCSAAEAWRYWKSLVGITLWKYHLRVDWCWNRHKITSVHRRRWAEVNAPVWDFKGHIGSDRQWGRGHRWYRAFTQGKFQLCFAGSIGCVQTKLPWVKITVHRRGTWSYQTGG